MKKKIFIVLIIIIIFLFFFLLYGPIPVFRNYIITTSMNTMSHKYIAQILYSDETINKVLSENTIIDPDEITDPSLININSNNKANVFSNKYEKEILNRNNKLYKVININEKTYKGYLVAIYDPSTIELATTKYIGKKGENILDISKREKAIVAINGGGFYDPNWDSNGSIPHGTIIKNNKVISDYKEASVGGGFIGFNKDNKLILGKMSTEKALSIYEDAIEFGPFLIINGKKSKIKGNGGLGIAPRTAIGQRRDGIVLFLIINGRIPTSIGADMEDLCNIMSDYGAYNAVNLDGGSSTELVINNKIKNHPVASGKYGLRDMATFWIVKK